jgi:hypothetical protein
LYHGQNTANMARRCRGARIEELGLWKSTSRLPNERIDVALDFG